jgi:hypothetical protein
MATNSIYHFTFTYGAAGGGDKGGGGDYYNGWTADAPGLYQQGQKFATKDGVYEIKHVDTYNVDLEQTYGKNFEAKSS